MRISLGLCLLFLLSLCLNGCSGAEDEEKSPDGDAAEQDFDSAESDGDTDSDCDEAADETENEAEADIEYHQDMNLEAERPQLHYTPESGWMNDPNGLVYYKGEYHLFHQYAPEGFFKSAMHWGHAVSTDLLHWEYLPIALFPDDEMGNVYSGSAVVDWNNSSGLCETDANGGQSCLVALFTHSGGSDGRQKQSLAYSNDRGRTWNMYAGNPVLEANPAIKDFRDPKVFYHDGTSSWIMLLSSGRSLLFYSSQNLMDWQYKSDFRMEPFVNFNHIWECPDIFQLPVENENGLKKWVLKVDVFDGGPYGGGSHGQYFVGDFDGNSFNSESLRSVFQWLNYGRDFYAAQSWSDIPAEDGRRIWIAWMNNWSYAIQIGVENWQGSMSLPRELSLRRTGAESGEEYRIIERPIAEFEQMRTATIKDESDVEIKNDSDISIKSINAPYEIECEIEDADHGELCFEIFNGSDSSASLCIDFEKNSVSVERNSSAAAELNPGFPGVHATPEGLQWKNPLKLRIFIDRNSLEAFIDDSQYVITELLATHSGASELLITASEADNVTLPSLAVYELRSIWAHAD